MNRVVIYLKQLEKFKLSQEDVRKSVDIFTNYDKKIYQRLIKIGCPDRLDFPNTTAYINALKPLQDDFIQVVLESLPDLEHKSGVVSFLREAKNKYDGKVLMPIFNESSKQDRWRICDAIVFNPPLNINNWVKDIYLSKQYEYSETGLLPLAIVKMFPKDEAREILRQGFDHHYRITPEALGKIGTVEDISFLEEKMKLKYDASHVHKDIKKAIEKIKRRAKLS